MKPSAKPRATTGATPNLHLTAAQVVMEVVDGGRSLDDALAAHAGDAPYRRRPWLREVGYGACRYYHYFDRILAELLLKPIKPRDRVLHFILINACHQLIHMRAPDYAVLNESVAAVSGTRFSWAAKMLNGVLRKFVAERERLERELARDEKNAAARCSFPDWLYREIAAHWPRYLPEIIEASNQKPPLTVRVNQRKLSRDAYLKRLADAGIEVAPTEHGALGVTFATPLPVADIPGLKDGMVSVQDESAQLTAAAMSWKPRDRVLDGCAAPGGKTCLLLESEPQPAEIVAVDLPARVGKIADNITRLGLDNDGASTAKIKIIAADLTEVNAWWDGRHFERILLDVPCSGSGIIRRHPDIKHRRRPDDIAKFAGQQGEFLRKAWSLLSNRGTLLYVTCSILPAENDAVIEKFLIETKDARAESLDAPPGVATRFGRQRLPGVHPGDGFYYCRLRKSPPPAAGDNLQKPNPT